MGVSNKKERRCLISRVTEQNGEALLLLLVSSTVVTMFGLVPVCGEHM